MITCDGTVGIAAYESTDVMEHELSPDLSAEPASKRQRAAMLAVAGFGLFLVFFELGSYRTLTKHEGFVAVVSREMLAEGDWVVPRFGGLPRLKKPPLMYWCAAATSAMFGRHSEWTCRLPSAMAALLLAALVGWWGSKWYGRNAGIAAALIQISCVYVLSFSRLAEVDMLLCLLTTTALFLVAGSSPQETRRRAFLRWTAIYGLIGLSWLAKFHYGPAMVLSVTVVWLAVQRRFRSFLQLLNPAGLFLLAAALVVWPYLLLRQLPGAWEIWQRETVGRAVGRLGRQPFWFYVPQIAVLTLPWAPLLLHAVPESWKRAWKQKDGRERFLWIWFTVQFTILTVSAFKHHHYLMAALPALSLIMGRSLATLVTEFQTGQRRLKRWETGAFFALFAAVAIAAPIIVGRKWPFLLTPAIAASVCIGIGGVCAVLLLHHCRFAWSLGTATTAFLGCYIAVMGWIIPGRDRRLPNVQFARSVNAQRMQSSETAVCVFGLKEHPVVYYLDRSAYRLEDEDDLAARLQQRKRLLIVAESSQTAMLSKLGTLRRLKTVRRESNGPKPKGPPLELLELTMPMAGRTRVAVWRTP